MNHTVAKVDDKNNKTLIKRIFASCLSRIWETVTQLIKNDKCDFTDYNTKDNKGKTIMNYLIENNKPDILQLLLSKPNVALDVAMTITREVTIFHNIIKNNQIDILKTLLHFNNKLVGKNILDITDSNGRTAIFYAIELENRECVELIQKYYFNIYNKDASGNNVMHYLITIRDDVAMFKSLKFSSYNTTNGDGETPLHLAIKWKRLHIVKYLLATKSCNLDAIENKYEFSILHYCCIMFDPTIFALFASHIKHMDNNMQDRFGKTPYFYFLDGYKNAEKSTTNATTTNNFNKLILHNFDYDLFDMNGDTPCHFALKQKIADDGNGNGKGLVANLIKNTNLNTQNFIGETCLYLLVKNNLWKTYKNILETKKLDIFITSKNKKSIINHVQNADKDEFIQMVANSYLFQLAKNKKGWIDKWDRKCANYKNMAKLTKEERDYLLQNGIVSENGKQICTSLIINSIKRSEQSYPKKTTENAIQISIENYPSASSFNNIYIGSTLEVLCGLIHLKNKFSTDMAYWVENMDNIVKCNRNGICEATGFSAKWFNGKLHDLRTDTISGANRRFVALPLSIDVVISNNPFHHLNYLIFDNELKEVERFEPHGSASPSGFDYHAISLDNIISHEVAKQGFQYFSPSTYLPKIGFQVREMNEEGLLPLSDPDGFCSLWCVWWCEMRLTYKNVRREKLVKLLFKEIAYSGISLKTMIRNYGYFVSAIRDKLLDSSGIEFVMWKNDEMDEKQVEKLNGELENIVTKNV